jgi:hypothetical protein
MNKICAIAELLGRLTGSKTNPDSQRLFRIRARRKLIDSPDCAMARKYYKDSASWCSDNLKSV